MPPAKVYKSTPAERAAALRRYYARKAADPEAVRRYERERYQRRKAEPGFVAAHQHRTERDRQRRRERAERDAEAERTRRRAYYLANAERVKANQTARDWSDIEATRRRWRESSTKYQARKRAEKQGTPTMHTLNAISNRPAAAPGRYDDGIPERDPGELPPRRAVPPADPDAPARPEKPAPAPAGAAPAGWSGPLPDDPAKVLYCPMLDNQTFTIQEAAQAAKVSEPRVYTAVKHGQTAGGWLFKRIPGREPRPMAPKGQGAKRKPGRPAKAAPSPLSRPARPTPAAPAPAACDLSPAHLARLLLSLQRRQAGGMFRRDVEADAVVVIEWARRVAAEFQRLDAVLNRRAEISVSGGAVVVEPAVQCG